MFKQKIGTFCNDTINAYLWKKFWSLRNHTAFPHLLRCITAAWCAKRAIFSLIAEQFSIECRETKTKAISLANHRRHRKLTEPISCKARSCCMKLTQSAGKRVWVSLNRLICNGNRTEWSPIRSVIMRVITKSDDRAAGVWLQTELDDTKSYHQLIIKITISEKRKIAKLWKKGKFYIKNTDKRGVNIIRPPRLLLAIWRQKHKSKRAWTTILNVLKSVLWLKVFKKHWAFDCQSAIFKKWCVKSGGKNIYAKRWENNERI